MKQAILTILALFLMAGWAMADGIPPGGTLTLSASYQAVTTTNKNGLLPFTIWTSDGSAFYVAADSSGGGEVLVPADSTPLAVYSNKAYVRSSGTLCYVKASVGTPTLYISVGPPEK
jgi:hypothetical protein